MEFAESHSQWQSLPGWVSFLLNFGFSWLDKPATVRRIAAVSMPIDSAAAGLISLGIIRKCLEEEDANDRDAHYQRLVHYARDSSSDIKLHYERSPGIFKFDGLDPDGSPCARQQRNRRSRVTITREEAYLWRVHDEAPVTANAGGLPLDPVIYDCLIPGGGAIRTSNLSTSYSHICLAGLGEGQMPTWRRMAEIRFRVGAHEKSLAELLTIQAWTQGTVSRLVYHNPRTGDIDRKPNTIRVVVADGDSAFLKSVYNEKFEDSDVIGVIHRDVERDKLEQVGTMLTQKRQRYDFDDSYRDTVMEIPCGIEVTVLSKGQ